MSVCVTPQEYTYDDLDSIEIPSNSSLPQLSSKAFFGILKDFTAIASSNSEASKVAVAINVICMFSAMVGRQVYQCIGDSIVHCRPFFIIVGKSGKARKGTAESLPRRVFQRVDEILIKQCPDHLRLNMHSAGLGSGEGLAFAIRDPSDDGKDTGVGDKRLLVIESEFANVLSNCKRETSTLSAVIRNVFDGRDLAPLTKTNRTRATKPHVVIIAHVTGAELGAKITNLEVSNGLLNRFLICIVAREKLVALPTPTSTQLIEGLANRIVDVIEFIHDEALRNGGTVEVVFSDEAKDYWVKVYPELSSEALGATGALLARSELYARMLAMIFSLLDKKLSIEVSHIQAALYWVDFVGDSVRFLFQQSQEEQTEQLAEKIITLLRENQCMTRTDISKALGGHKTGEEIKVALEFLLSQTPARVSQSKDNNTGGCPKVIYELCEICEKTE